MRIHLIDDDPAITSLLKDFIEERFQADIIDVSSSGGEAITKIKKQTYDISLVDLELGDYYGTEVINYIKDYQPKNICIIITGFPSFKSAHLAVEQSVFGYLTKPLNLNELQLLLNNAMKLKDLEHQVQLLMSQTVYQAREAASSYLVNKDLFDQKYSSEYQTSLDKKISFSLIGIRIFNINLPAFSIPDKQQLLKELGILFSESLKIFDTVGFFNGSFFILLPFTDNLQADKVAHNIAERLQAQSFIIADQPFIPHFFIRYTTFLPDNPVDIFSPLEENIQQQTEKPEEEVKRITQSEFPASPQEGIKQQAALKTYQSNLNFYEIINRRKLQ